VQWHIVTGEYPPQLGGVSDYTYQLSKELAKQGDRVHIWSPAPHSEVIHSETGQIHALPHGFGWSWLRELNRRLQSFNGPRNILIQYVPHMYGWKSMNFAFCAWICMQRRHNVSVMFHEVAFPMERGQRLRHRLLAIAHRVMAGAILRSVRHSFTSTEQYLHLLQNLGNSKSAISLLRICSNIPSESYQWDSIHRQQDNPGAPFTIGIFSNFATEIREVLTPVIGSVLENPKIAVALLGPGEEFRQSLLKKYPQAANRIRSTGRLHVSEVAERMRGCNALLQIYPDGASAARGTLIAALASGIPVITTAGPNTDKLLLESNTMLFSDLSPQSIRACMEKLSQNPAMARDFGIRAQRLYQESFQPSVIVSRLREVASDFDTATEVVTYPAVASASKPTPQCSVGNKLAS
jgi:glycosyltransferase involved in cell wall biosynthesis